MKNPYLVDIKVVRVKNHHVVFCNGVDLDNFDLTTGNILRKEVELFLMNTMRIETIEDLYRVLKERSVV